MQQKNSIKIVIDTNIWISYFFGKSVKLKLKSILFDNRFNLLFSDDLMNELTNVMSRPKFKKYITKSDISEIKEALEIRADFIDVLKIDKACRDSKDDFVLALCKYGNADYLISGDEDIISITNIKKPKIIKLSDFYSLFFQE